MPNFRKQYPNIAWSDDIKAVAFIETVAKVIKQHDDGLILAEEALEKIKVDMITMFKSL